MTDRHPLDGNTDETADGSQDDFMKRLSAANPVDDRTAPSPHDAAAQHLLENAIMQNTQNAETGGYVSHGHIPGQYDQANVINGTPGAPAPSRRGRGMLVGAAAAVLVLLGGLLVFLPDNTPAAVATVRSAAAAAADSDTGRIETTFSASGTDGQEQGQINGSFVAAYSGSDVAFTVNVEASDAAAELEEIPVNEVRLVDGIVYIDDGAQWLALDTDGLIETW